ncbi:F-box/kelch-repeat protein [Trifolium medium]|uniref:F-box/kelch-repeat protein n=1 Tax=Trifolium medium TaxID=97028 RepID=A0A392MCI1_9FABA|nr:F-box/kelch-repeat protein [Trifolium medium]
MYDSLSNEWTEISRLPLIASSGTFCGSKFYVCSSDEKLAAYDIERDVWIEIQTYPPFAPNINAQCHQLVSSNGRLFLMSKLHLLATRTKVKQLWELDLMDHTWTEISMHHGDELDGKSEVYVADRNLIFGVEMLKGVYDNIFDYFTVCDVSESNTNVYWKKISWKGVDPKWGAYPSWTRPIAVVHVNI